MPSPARVGLCVSTFANHFFFFAPIVFSPAEENRRRRRRRCAAMRRLVPDSSSFLSFFFPYVFLLARVCVFFLQESFFFFQLRAAVTNPGRWTRKTCACEPGESAGWQVVDSAGRRAYARDRRCRRTVCYYVIPAVRPGGGGGVETRVWPGESDTVGL